VSEGTRELRLVITAPDYDAALTFYRDVLGLRQEAAFVDDNGGRAALLHAGRATLELGDSSHAEAVDTVEVGHPLTQQLRVAFEVADAAATADRLVRAGATALGPPVVTPWGSTNARLTGPGGQQVSVWSTDIYLTERARLDTTVTLADPDPTWASLGRTSVDAVRAAVGLGAIVAAHVGSTSVPGLAAKPVLDLVLGVGDPTDEPSYLPALTRLGYELILREPHWYQHRLLRRTGPAVNLHVFAAGSTEIEAMLTFRDHLRRHTACRARYGQAKAGLAARQWAFTQDYADAKSDVVAAVMECARSAGPAPVRGSFLVVRQPASVTGTALARDLARALDLPLFALASLWPPPPRAQGASLAAMLEALVALAADSGGAVLDLPPPHGRDADLSRLPGRVIELGSDLEIDAPTGADVDDLARTVRQMVASP